LFKIDNMSNMVIKIRKNTDKYKIVRCSSCGVITVVKTLARYDLCPSCFNSRKDEKADPRIVGNCILIKADEGDRCAKNYKCDKYSECLKVVAELNWRGFIGVEKKRLSLKFLDLAKILLQRKKKTY